MLNLLRFYIPQVFKNIMFFFIIAAVVSVLVLISPMNKDLSEMITTSIFVIFLPAYTYFNRSNYLSASIGWILQTPVSKIQIILANGIINLFKMILLVGLMSLAYLVIAKESPLPGILNQDLPTESSLLSTTALPDQFQNIFIVLGFVAVLFGILPDFLHTAHEKRQQTAPLSIKELKPKKIVKNFLFLSMGVGIYILLESDVMPGIIQANIVFCLALLAATILTLSSVKYIYNIKIPIVAATIIFIITTMLSFQIAKSQINNPNITLDKRFETADFLGAYGDNSYELLFNELKSGSELTIDIGRQDLEQPVLFNGNAQLVKSASDALKILCAGRLDHTCRLYAYISSIARNQMMEVDYFRMGCPKDLSSCGQLAIHVRATPQDIGLAEARLGQVCKFKHSELDQRICNHYYLVKARLEKKPKF